MNNFRLIFCTFFLFGTLQTVSAQTYTSVPTGTLLWKAPGKNDPSRTYRMTKERDFRILFVFEEFRNGSLKPIESSVINQATLADLVLFTVTVTPIDKGLQVLLFYGGGGELMTPYDTAKDNETAHAYFYDYCDNPNQQKVPFLLITSTPKKDIETDKLVRRHQNEGLLNPLINDQNFESLYSKLNHYYLISYFITYDDIKR